MFFWVKTQGVTYANVSECTTTNMDFHTYI